MPLIESAVRKSRSVYLSFSVAVALGIGCQESKKLDSIDRTSRKTQSEAEELNSGSKDLNRNTKDLKKGIESLKVELDSIKDEVLKAKAELTLARNRLDLVALSTNNTYKDLRKAQSLDLRRSLWADLQTPIPLKAKIVAAYQYFAAHEFQFWKADSETPEDFDALLSEGISEFQGQMLSVLAPEDLNGDYQPFAFPKDRNQETIFALSLALDFAGFTHPGVSPSMENAFKQALDLNPLLESADQPNNSLTKSQRTALAQLSVAKILLAQRANSLSAYVVANVSKISEVLPWSLLDLGLMKTTKWPAKTEGLSVVLLEDLSEKLKLAVELKSFMNQNGVFKFSEDLKFIVRNVSWRELTVLQNKRNLKAEFSSTRLKALSQLESLSQDWAQ